MKKQNNVIIGIYKITNPKGKIYIGKSKDISCRKKTYMYLNSVGTKIKNSIKKYGWEQHNFEIIEECTLEQLNEREIYWIKYYDSTNCGLNIGLGGEGGNMTQQTKDKISKNWKNKSDEEKNNINKKRGLGNKNKPKPNSGYRNWKDKDLNRLILSSPFNQPNWSEKCKKPVLMLSKENNTVLKEFNSIAEAASFVGITQGSLSFHLTGRSKTSGGYVWRYKKINYFTLKKL